MFKIGKFVVMKAEELETVAMLVKAVHEAGTEVQRKAATEYKQALPSGSKRFHNYSLPAYLWKLADALTAIKPFFGGV